MRTYAQLRASHHDQGWPLRLGILLALLGALMLGWYVGARVKFSNATHVFLVVVGMISVGPVMTVLFPMGGAAIARLIVVERYASPMWMTSDMVMSFMMAFTLLPVVWVITFTTFAVVKIGVYWRRRRAATPPEGI